MRSPGPRPRRETPAGIVTFARRGAQALGLVLFATVHTFISVPTQWGYLLDAISRPGMLLWPARPVFRYLLVGTFVWWFLVGLAGLLLWSRRRRLADVLAALPGVLAGAVMFVFYNRVMSLSQSGADRWWAVGWPFVVCRGDKPDCRDWNLPGVVLNFAFWLAALGVAGLILWVVWRRLGRWRTGH